VSNVENGIIGITALFVTREKFYNGSKYEVRMHEGDDEYIDEQDLYFLRGII